MHSLPGGSVTPKDLGHAVEGDGGRWDSKELANEISKAQVAEPGRGTIFGKIIKKDLG